MKLLIDINKKDYEYMKDGYVPHTFNMFYAIKTGIPIPNNTTNGDVIKEIFPNTSLHINEMSHTVWVGCEEMSFRIDWWNSPYQEGE